MFKSKQHAKNLIEFEAHAKRVYNASIKMMNLKLGADGYDNVNPYAKYLRSFIIAYEQTQNKKEEQ